MRRLDLVVGSNGAGKSTFIALVLAPLLPGSVIVKTVFSHPSKLDLLDEAHARGFTVVVHALLIPEDLAVERVARRVSAGGHRVPEVKIRGRYRRLWSLVVSALARADLATVYDNSKIEGPRICARMAAGQIIGAPKWPEWAPAPLTSRWP